MIKKDPRMINRWLVIPQDDGTFEITFTMIATVCSLADKKQAEKLAAMLQNSINFSDPSPEVSEAIPGRIKEIVEIFVDGQGG